MAKTGIEGLPIELHKKEMTSHGLHILYTTVTGNLEAGRKATEAQTWANQSCKLRLSLDYP